MELDLGVRGFKPRWGRDDHSKYKLVSCVAKVNGKARQHSSRRQTSQFEKLERGKFPGLTVISSNPTDHQAHRVAEYFFKSMMKTCDDENAPIDSYPYWHVFQGGFDNPLVKAYRTFRNIRALFITNCFHNSTQQRIEKCRDLIHFYNDVPKILVTGGMNGLQFCVDHLHVAPNYVLYYEPDKVMRV